MELFKKVTPRQARKIRRAFKAARKDIKRINKRLDAFINKLQELDLLLSSDKTITELIKTK